MNARTSRPRPGLLASLALGAVGTLGTVGVFGSAAAAAAELDLTRLPAAAGRPVAFATDIQPILEKACLRCHGPERPKGGYRLDNPEAAVGHGERGPAIVPGNSAGSPFIHYVARLVPEMEMPPEGKGDPLTPAEIGLLRAWIDQGARWSGNAAEPRIEFSVTPAVQFVSVDGNVARFREHNWTREGWGGGATDFSLKYDTDPRTRVEIDGRALAGPDDYRFRTRIERDDLGWTRFEYREFSRWEDDTGGYYAPFGTPAPRWGDDFVLRHRQATAEFGLTLPDWPQLRLAYDLHLRDGTESTLHWGSVTAGGVSRAIYPGRKRVDETTHRVTLDIAYDWDGLLISDEAQFEWHGQDNERQQRDVLPPPIDYATLVRDSQDSWRGANVLRLERTLRDWLYVSGGYLYSQLRDAGGFSVESFAPTDPTVPPSLDLAADDLTLRRQSHVVNGNAMLGPWEQLHFYAGLQAEWTRQEGFAMGRTYGTATAYDADVDRAATDENFGLRYAGIPWTVVFAETRFQQETYSQFEEGLADAQQAFLRDTDAEGDTRDYEAGFTIAPWRVASFQAKYRHRDRANDYAHPRDVDLFSSGNGYPAFLLARDTTGDEVEGRLVLQPWRWLKTTLKYAVSGTDFESETASWEDLSTFPATPIPGGRLLAGEYDARTASLGLVLTPWRRLYLASTLSWTTSESTSGNDNGQEVVPYEGDVWNLLQTATFVLDEKTDLLASWLWSDGDYSQDNAAAGLPLGIAYTRNAATAGITRRMKHDRVLRLEYGFFTYDEPTLGGAADYTAHALFASFRIPWP